MIIFKNQTGKRYINYTFYYDEDVYRNTNHFIIHNLYIVFNIERKRNNNDNYENIKKR